MKNIVVRRKFFLIIFAALFVVSCSTEDGTDGVNGTNGIDGERGEQGPEGPAGADGNADTQEFILESSDRSGSGFIFTLPVSGEVVSAAAVLVYYRASSGFIYSVPGVGPGFLFDSRVNFSGSGSTTQLIINFFDTGDATIPYPITAGDILRFRVLVIPVTTSTTEGKTTPQQQVLNELEAAGVDSNDYEEVAEYYNIDTN